MCLKYMERYYNIAGIDVCIAGNAEELYTNERRLSNFRTEKAENAHRFEFHIVDQLQPPKGNSIYTDDRRRVYTEDEKEVCYMDPSLRIERGKHCTEVQVLSEQIADRITAKLILNSLGIEQLVAKADALVIHASYIIWNGKAILFTAPSGTGKSTQAELWKEYKNTKIVNGDRAIIRVKDGVIEACGLPYAGSSEYCENITAPLGAIVYLGQGNTCTVNRLTGSKAFRSVLEGTSVITWKKEDMERVISVIQTVLTSVPVYHYICTPDETAVITLENELRKEW